MPRRDADRRILNHKALLRLQAHLLGTNTLTGAALQAADLNGDGQVTITDMIRLQAYLLGRGTIQPN